MHASSGSGPMSRRTFLAASAASAAAVAAARGAGAQDAPETFAEKLGYPKGARVVIINADDSGMSYATNKAVRESMDMGITTSTTVMMPTPWVPDSVKYIKESNVCAGLHFTLCSEWDGYRMSPLAGFQNVPGLAFDGGCFPDNNRDLTANATAEEIEKELRAQIARAELLGLKYTHFDSHMWSVFEKPEYTEIYVKLALEKHVPIRLVAGVPGGYAAADHKMTLACQPHIQRVWDAGLVVLDDMQTQNYGWKTTDKLDLYIQDIRNTKPGITEFVVHPTHPGEEIDEITGKRITLYGDYFTLTNPRILEVIKEEGIILASWRDLQAKRDAQMKQAQS